MAAVSHNPQSRQLTVMLVDDHRGFRRAALAELEAGGLQVIGEVDRAATALDTARALRPDIVLLDIRLPDGDGVALADEVMLALPASAVVLTSSMNADDARERLSAAESSVPFIPKAGLSASALRSAATGRPGGTRLGWQRCWP